MDDGIQQEVRLFCTPEAVCGLEISHGSESGTIELQHSLLREILDGKVAGACGSGYHCDFSTDAAGITFSVQGPMVFQFAMPRQQFSLLVKSLGILDD